MNGFMFRVENEFNYDVSIPSINEPGLNISSAQVARYLQKASRAVSPFASKCANKQLVSHLSVKLLCPQIVYYNYHFH